MSKNIRQNRRCEPKVSQIDRQGWKSLLLVLLKIILTCILAIGIPYGIYVYYQHEVNEGRFQPSQITIHGNVRADDASILDASGLSNEDTNLFEADIHVLETSIETLAWVKKAKITIDLPDKVDIEITEHEPLGIVNDGQLYIVDETGTAIKYWTTEDTIITPIVSLDKVLDVRSHAVVKAFQLADEVVRLGFPHKIQEIHYDDATGYTLYTDTTEIRVGYDRFDERIQRLLAVNDILETKKITADYILIDGDNSLDQIVVKPKPKVVFADPVQDNKPADAGNDGKTEKPGETADQGNAKADKPADAKQQAPKDKPAEAKQQAPKDKPADAKQQAPKEKPAEAKQQAPKDNNSKDKPVEAAPKPANTPEVNDKPAEAKPESKPEMPKGSDKKETPAEAKAEAVKDSNTNEKPVEAKPQTAPESTP